MEIDVLREFVVFSRYLNVSRAARHLNLAQPTLSGHIAALEKELGFELLQREGKMRLTPAGKRFTADAERMLSSFDESVAACREISKQKSGALVFERPIRHGGLDREFDRLLLLFERENPAIAVRTQASTDMPLREVLESGRADAALVFNDAIEAYDPALADELGTLPLPDRERGPYYLWVDRSHPLAGRERVSVGELGGCRFLIPSSIRYQSLESLARAAVSMTGAPVTCTYWPGSYEESVVQVKPDEAIIVTDEDRRDPAYDLVENRVYVPLEGMDELVRPAFVYLRKNANPALRAFADFVRGQGSGMAGAEVAP